MARAQSPDCDCDCGSHRRADPVEIGARAGGKSGREEDAAEELHAEEREDEKDEAEEEQKPRERDDGVEESADQVLEGRPRAEQLEHAQDSERTQRLCRCTFLTALSTG